MAKNADLAGTAVIVVNHPEYGNGLKGMIICNQVKQLLRECKGPLCFFHDASEMVSASLEYLTALMDIRGDLAGRDVCVVCAVPRFTKRIMLYMLSKFSRRKWKIFKSRQNAVDYLTLMGADNSILVRAKSNVIISKSEDLIAV